MRFANLLYRLILMGSPQRAMGIDPDKDLVVFVSATNKEQSKDNAFTDLATTLGRVPWFERWLASSGQDEIRLRTPGDLERSADARRRGLPVLDRASIVIRAISSSAPSARGGRAGCMAWFEGLLGARRRGADLPPLLPGVRALLPRRGVTGGGGRCPWCAGEISPVGPEFRSFGVPRFLYRGHADPAEGHDNFTACIAHLQKFTEPDGTPTVHIVVDRLMTWIPADYEGRQLPFPEIQAELAQVISRFPHMRLFSYDQFGALATIRGTKDLLKLAGVKVPVRKLVHTEANNRERAEIVKEALANNWIHVPRDAFGPNGTCLLEQEMKFLQLRHLRLIKPTTGPVRTDDLWTAFSSSGISSCAWPERTRGGATSGSRASSASWGSASEPPPFDGSSRPKA